MNKYLLTRALTASLPLCFTFLITAAITTYFTIFTQMPHDSNLRPYICQGKMYLFKSKTIS